jgi:hypothetical protein
MSTLVHLGANSNSSKQKLTFSHHQNAITATSESEPYPAAGSVVSLYFGL